MHEFLAPYAEPMRVQMVEGEVVVLGPDGVAVSLTPEAAEESARRLIDAAREARACPASTAQPAQLDPAAPASPATARDSGRMEPKVGNSTQKKGVG